MKGKSAKQIVHEAEVTRQYARYKIPAIIEIDNNQYKIEVISLGGCSIENLPKEYYEKKKFAVAKLIFKFDNNFEITVDDINIEFVSIRQKDKDSSVTGALFHNINEYQYSILNQIINAYVNGDIVTTDDILQAVTRQITYPKEIKKSVDKKKANLILILIYLIIAFLLSFLLYVVYQKVYIVKTANGYVDANMISVKAPYPSYIEYVKKIKPNDSVEKNETIAVAHLIGGGVQDIYSPINGTIYKVNALNGEFKNTGEPIFTLFPKNYEIYVVAMIDHKLIKKLSLGYIANVKLSNNKEFKAKVVSIQAAQNIAIEKSKVLKNVYNRPIDYDKIILKPLKPLSKDLINSSVYVTIDTLFNKGK